MLRKIILLSSLLIGLFTVNLQAQKNTFSLGFSTFPNGTFKAVGHVSYLRSFSSQDAIGFRFSYSEDEPNNTSYHKDWPLINRLTYDLIYRIKLNPEKQVVFYIDAGFSILSIRRERPDNLDYALPPGVEFLPRKDFDQFYFRGFSISPGMMIKIRKHWSLGLSYYLSAYTKENQLTYEEQAPLIHQAELSVAFSF